MVARINAWPRVQEFMEFPGKVYDATKDTVKTIAGIGASALSIFPTFGMNEKINEYADWTEYSATILPTLYRGIIEIANPNAILPEELKLGLVTNHIADPIIDYGYDVANNREAFKKHVVSRGAFILAPVVAIITGLVDMILGCVGVALSSITLGTKPKINAFTMRNLTFPYLIHHICVGIRGFVNPQQFVDPGQPGNPEESEDFQESAKPVEKKSSRGVKRMRQQWESKIKTES